MTASPAPIAAAALSVWLVQRAECIFEHDNPVTSESRSESIS
jgi:hypothetical protein